MALGGLMDYHSMICERKHRHFAMDPFKLFDPQRNVRNAMGTSYNLFKPINYLNSNIGFDFQMVTHNSLHRAVMTGDCRILKTLLRICSFVENKDQASYTALHYATMLGQTQMVQLLLDAGCCINSRGLNKVTPLHMACYHNHKDVVTILLRDKRIDMGARSFTSLHLAAELGHLEIIQLLIDTKAQINAKSKKKENPLHLALVFKRWEAVTLLLANGADPNAKRHDGRYPLHLAIVQGVSVNIAEQLIPGSGNIDATDHVQYTPLHVAAQFGRWDITKLLIDRGANPLARTDQGMTPLHLVAFSFYIEADFCAVARCLCEKLSGEDVNSVDGWRRTPLYYAARYGTEEMVKYLLDEQAANVNAIARSFRTPLHFAVSMLDERKYPKLDGMAREPYAAVIQLLIDHGADVNAPDKRQIIPLHLAAEYCEKEVVKLLLGAGSFYDAHANTRKRQTPRERAEYNGINNDIIDQVARFFEMVEQNKVADARSLLTDDPWMVGCRSANQGSPLHVSYTKRHYGMTQLLLEFGAKVDQD